MNSEYEIVPPTSHQSHDCKDKDCYFCSQYKDKISQIIPLLPQAYMSDIRKAGGWYMFRDKALLENSKTFKTEELRRIKERIRLNEKNLNKRKSA